jgi:hypothetical protein
MKKVIIKNKDGVIGWGAEMLDPTQWIADCIANNVWGFPERWVLHKDEPMAPAYDEADVLEERIVEDMPAVEAVLISEAIPGRPAVMDEAGNIVQAEIPETPAVYSEAIPARTHKEVKLRAEYVVEISDITQMLELQSLSTEALRYLESTDWMVLRHIRQKALGSVQSLTDEQYLELEQTRAEKATLVVK